MRVHPKPWIGIVVYLTYLAVFYGVWIATGIDYPRVGESETTLLTWYVLPLASGAIVLVVAASVLGWWKPAVFEKRHAPRWLLIAPAVMLVAAILTLFTKDLSATTTMMWVYLALGSLLVGFCEEMATRGILIVGLRGRFRETLVWLISTSLFAALHIPNIFFGVGASGLLQVVITFFLGTLLYIARRASGTLIVPILLHGIWDFCSFAGVYTSDAAQTGTFLLTTTVVILGAVFIIFTLRNSRGQKLEQLTARSETLRG